MAPFTVTTFLREQWTKLPLATADLSNKTVILTGSNVGLGFEAAVHLANMKPGRFIITARDQAKCDKAKKEIEARAQEGIGAIVASPLELTSFESVRAFVDEFAAGSSKLDVLIANAAVSLQEYTQTGNGWETTVQVNHLSAALLSISMLPHLAKAGTEENPARLVIVSSEAHYMESLKGASKWPNILERLSDKSYCTPAVMRARYPISKLLEVEFAARLSKSTPVVIDAVNPGFCKSQLTRNVAFYLQVVAKVGKALLARSTEMGSRTLVHAAVAPGEKERHGHYVSACNVAEESDFVLSEEGQEVQRRLWDETIEVLSKVDPRVNGIVTEYLST
ncbi:short-chain dehydrogenase [Coniophora puteana RWD-64-598 SS2]|uniref:Short-chain dehydrogenase n=1 Tax=Coniophora puteana (strain RWD-64-598) TaxID=741705 RepID=A0A5M3MV91_CONPW|nr:short-chain dehydrogenase [Coniophora puteana RWD-64-598 SS2]EIW83043.1 short-chain dehydrogenase [Coniophora puteana RWD-64-598 SS2]